MDNQDILGVICEHLYLSDIIRLIGINKYFYTALREPNIWYKVIDYEHVLEKFIKQSLNNNIYPCEHIKIFKTYNNYVHAPTNIVPSTFYKIFSSYKCLYSFGRQNYETTDKSIIYMDSLFGDKMKPSEKTTKLYIKKTNFGLNFDTTTFFMNNKFLREVNISGRQNLIRFGTSLKNTNLTTIIFNQVYNIDNIFKYLPTTLTHLDVYYTFLKCDVDLSYLTNLKILKTNIYTDFINTLPNTLEYVDLKIHLSKIEPDILTFLMDNVIIRFEDLRTTDVFININLPKATRAQISNSFGLVLTIRSPKCSQLVIR
jgi:hypothetical protein